MAQQGQQVNLKIKGLYTSANNFSGVPDGALDVADDIVVDYDNLAEPRRGFEKLEDGDFPLVSDHANRFATYQGKVIAHYGTNKLAYYDSGWNDYSGTYDFPDADLAKSRFMEANQNLYVTTSLGVKKLDAYDAEPVFAGIPKGLDLQLSLTGSSGFLTTNTVSTVTGNTTNASPTLSEVSDISGIAEGQYIFGTGIPSGTTVSSITPSSTVLFTVGTITAGSTSMTAVPTNANLAAGQLITGEGIVDGTRIASLSGAGPYTVTMTQAAIATEADVAVQFASDPIITMSQNASATAAGVSVVFSEGSQVGYRGIFGYRDANNNLLYGAPTQFNTVTNNTGTTSNVVVTMTIPAGITVDHFFQIYRTAQTASAQINPFDDEQLVYEGNPSPTDISNGYIQITDTTPDSLRGAFLYTSNGQEGIEQQNDQPPFCKDFCSFNEFAIYANVKSKQQKKITVLAVGAPNGVQIGDTITIGGVVFTAAAAEDSTAGEFQIFSSGTPAQNISDTANSLIKVINRYASNTITYAYLLSGPTDLPGQIMLEERGVGASAFVVIASAHGSAYSPSLPTSGSTVSSAQTVYKNGIVVSKKGEPEAAPFQNILFAGSASKEILRVIPLREYVVVLKQDGIWRLTGKTYGQLSCDPFDGTTKLIAPDSAVALSNEVFGFFDQGICSVSDTGVNLRSRAIEATLRELVGSSLATIKQIAFGVGYETDHKYILALPESSGDEVCRQEFVFNTFTNTWTRWTRVATAGFVNEENDRLYFGNGDSNDVSVERKSFDYTDYVDEGFDATIASSSDYSVVLSSVTGITVGDVLYQSADDASVITEIDIATNAVTVQDLIEWTVGAATVLPAIDSIIQWKPAVAGNPAFVRQYSEGVAMFKRTRFNQGTVSFFSDVSQSFEEAPLEGFPIANWGGFAWGSAPWGGSSRPRSIRFLVPENKQMASQLTTRLRIRNGYANWACEGVSISFNPVSQEVSD